MTNLEKLLVHNNVELEIMLETAESCCVPDCDTMDCGSHDCKVKFLTWLNSPADRLYTRCAHCGSKIYEGGAAYSREYITKTNPVTTKPLYFCSDEHAAAYDEDYDRDVAEALAKGRFYIEKLELSSKQKHVETEL